MLASVETVVECCEFSATTAQSLVLVSHSVELPAVGAVRARVNREADKLVAHWARVVAQEEATELFASEWKLCPLIRRAWSLLR